MRWRLIAVGCAMEGAYLLMFASGDPVTGVALFIVVNAVCYCLLGFLLAISGKAGRDGSNAGFPEADRWVVPVIVAFALIFRLTLVFHDPVASGDIYRYLWDGKVAVAGHNPYRLAPSDSTLNPLHTDIFPSRISFPEMRTIYPPLSQIFFAMSSLLFGDSPAGLKLLLVIADLCSVLLLLRLSARAGMRSGSADAGASPRRVLPYPVSILLYAWSPVPVMYIALDGHIDGLGVTFFLLFILLTVEGKRVRSGVVLGLASLVKLYPLLVVPFVRRFREGTRWWVPLIPVIFLAVGYLLYAEPTGGIFESLLAYNTRFEFNGPVYSLITLVLNRGPVSHIVCGGLLLVWLVYLYRRNMPMEETLLLIFLGFLFLSPTAHPWYFTWVAALLVLRWSPAVFVLLGLTNLTNLVVLGYTKTGLWEDSKILILLEYLPFLLMFFGELWWRKPRRLSQVTG